MELAFVADWDGDWEVYKIRADGSQLTQLTHNSTEDSDPVWSRDGQQIVLELDTFRPRLHIIRADGSGGRTVGPDSDAIAPKWSPFGEQIAFLDFDDQDIDDIFLLNTTTGEVRRLTEGTNIRPGDPTFSPDGGMVAFHAGVPGRTPDTGLFVVKTDGTGLRELASLDGEDIRGATWRPNSDQILIETSLRAGGNGLYLIGLDGDITQLPTDPTSPTFPSPVWSPDGSLFAYITATWGLDPQGNPILRSTLHVASPDGETDIAVIEPPDDPEAEMALSLYDWAPDGRHIAYSVLTTGSEVTDLLVLDICTGTSSLVVEDIEVFSDPSWRPLP